jgi:hypothetical protein
MPIVFRQHTFPTFPADYLDESGSPTMPFRDYHVKVWEPWMKRSYSEATMPFLVGPEASYASQLDPSMLACTEVCSQAVVRLAKVAMAPLTEEMMFALCGLWTSMSVEEREDVLLEIFQTGHEASERASYPMLIVEAPEFTLSRLAGGDGSGIFPLLLTTWSFGRIDFSKERIPVIENDEWERLWCCGRHKPAVPLSRAKRAFIDSAIANRAALLLNFHRTFHQ